MKPIKLMIALAFGGAVIFQSCKKNDNNYVATPASKNIANTQNNIASGNFTEAAGIINCQLTVIFPDPTPQLQWNSGYITTTSLVFNGTHIVGNMLSQTTFPTQINQTIQLSKSVALEALAYRQAGSTMDHFR